MNNDKRLTPAEWELMETIWDLGESPTVRDVLEKAFPNGEKAYTTVQTVMNTLMKKNFLTRKKIGMVNFYSPAKSRNQMVGAETTRIVSNLFKGSIPAFANYLIDSDTIDLEQIEAIKEMLTAKETKLREADND